MTGVQTCALPIWRGKFKEKVTGLKDNKRDLKRYDIENNNTITMPEQRPYRKGYQFVGWSLDKIGVRGNTQKSYSDKSGNKLLYKPGEKFVITDDVAGLYKIDKSGDILYSGYATPEHTYKTGVPTKDNDLKLCFVAN